MKSWIGAVVARLAILACVPVLAFAQEAPAPAGVEVPTLEAVLVTGAVPGPGLWRVSRSGSPRHRQSLTFEHGVGHFRSRGHSVPH